MRVAALMTAPAISVGPDMPLKQAARLLVERRITGAPVLENGSVVGVVSTADIVAAEQETEEELLAGRRFGRLRRRPWPPHSARRVRDVMSSPAVTVHSHDSAVAAAWAMTQHDVNRLPVVDGGRLVGVVTRSDLVRAFVRSDDEVWREVVQEVLPALSVSRNDVDVQVIAGVVTLRGEVEDEVEARCLPHAVRGVVGVVDVVAELTARHGHTPFDRLSATL